MEESLEWGEHLDERSILIEDITDAVLKMPAPRGFLQEDPVKGVAPVYHQKIEALFLLMHWPIIPTLGDPLVSDNSDGSTQSSIDEDKTAPSVGLSLYTAIMNHGKTHIAEVFFADEETGKYRGSHRVFSLKFPNNHYSEDFDPWLMEELATRVLGVRRNMAVGHELQF